MTTLDAILAAVIDRPDDDTPRLAYADELEELAGDTPDPAAARARAEFIRVQVELARVPRRHVVAEPVALTKHGPDYWECPGGATADTGILVIAAAPGDRVDILRAKNPLLGLRVVKFLDDPAEPRRRGDVILARDDRSGPDTSGQLRRREGDLFTASRSRGWGLGSGWRHTVHAPTVDPDYGASTPAALFRRGWVDEVRCDLRTWYGGECWRCGGDGRVEAPNPQFTRRCPACEGTPGGDDYRCSGRVPGIGPAVVRRHPVRRVVPTDVEPTRIRNTISDDDRQWTLFLPPTCSLVLRWWHESPDAARDALSAALLAWAKGQPVTDG